MRKEALEATDKAISMGEDSAASYFMRAKLLQETGKFPEATVAFEKTLAAPGINATQTASVQLELARNDSAQGRHKAALMKLDALIDATPNKAQLLLFRGQTRYEALQIEGALSDFDAAIAASPNELGAYASKALVLIAERKPDAAAGALAAMTANNPLNFDAYARAGELYYNMGRAADARAAAERSLILRPTAQVYLDRARYRLATERVEALADIKSALALDRSIRNLARAGLMQIRLRDYDGAVPTLTAGMALSDDVTFPTYLIAAYEASGRTDLAAKQYDALRAKKSKDANALNTLCWAQATSNVTLARALTDCDAAIALQRNAAFFDSRGLVLLRLGRNDEAIAAYDRALDMHPKQAASLYGRGLAKLAKGDSAQGLADLRTATDGQPSVVGEFSSYGLEPPAL
jgi:tetratricopeptide (TPR) repeat protein